MLARCGQGYHGPAGAFEHREVHVVTRQLHQQGPGMVHDQASGALVTMARSTSGLLESSSCPVNRMPGIVTMPTSPHTEPTYEDGARLSIL